MSYWTKRRKLAAEVKHCLDVLHDECENNSLVISNDDTPISTGLENKQFENESKNKPNELADLTYETGPTHSNVFQCGDMSMGLRLFSSFRFRI